ncbi:type VI secretion system-associated protein TagF [Chitinimonas viridis]|uniref:Type VI secretion system-associated protein TagF n=2 Tax=Chitinimonas TaxID=240411 RepID=A0ABT8BBS9_9NEIS|nr:MULTISPECIES: type VI secretion system-associated protein TagF [Chitinimonas]MDN3579207.1 type VI secretion system-associated protein TagF [Chitinimonas viridis]GLR15298.1 type VI secretion-associated protein [Chitinimonas prasina]
MSQDLPIAGWYGKMPSLSDFASRRLDSTFIDAWDSWLRTSLLASREKLGQAWLERYLNARVWRFLLAPGVCGQPAYAGVMMPSVDGVGRYYPLTVCAPLSSAWAARLARAEGQCWFDQIETIALAALSRNLSPEQLDEALARVPMPRAQNEDAQLDNAVLQLADAWRLQGGQASQSLLSGGRSLNDVFGSLGRQTVTRLCEGKSLWWVGSREQDALRLVRFDNMPPPYAYAQFLAGAAAEATAGVRSEAR